MEWNRFGRPEEILRQAGLGELTWNEDPIQNELILAAQRVADLESQVVDAAEGVVRTARRVVEQLGSIGSMLNSLGVLQSEGPKFDAMVAALVVARAELGRLVKLRIALDAFDAVQ